MEGSFNQDGLVSSAAGRLRGGREEEEEEEVGVEREGDEQEDEEKEGKVEEKVQEEEEEDVKEEEEVLVCCVRWQQNVNLYILGSNSFLIHVNIIKQHPIKMSCKKTKQKHGQYIK